MSSLRRGDELIEAGTEGRGTGNKEQRRNTKDHAIHFGRADRSRRDKKTSRGLDVPRSPFPVPRFSSKRHLEPGRQIHTGRKTAQLILARFGHFVYRIVDGGGDQVFSHFRIVGE